MEWNLTESDPSLFNCFCDKCEVDKVDFVEVLTFDDECFQNIDHLLGFIFCFKYVSSSKPITPEIASSPDLFFAHQIVNNVCATQAVLHLLMNKSDRIKLGPLLSELRNFSESFDANSKGLAIANCEVLKTIHNSFVTRNGLVDDTCIAQSPDKGEAFHFVTFLEFKGYVYQLDGLHDSPICLEKVEEHENWLNICKKHIQQKIADIQANQNEIRFNLLAVKIHPEKFVNAEIEKTAVNIRELEEVLKSNPEKEIYDELTRTLDDLNKQMLELRIQEEQIISKKLQDIEECEIRKLDYVPLILECVNQLGKKGIINNIL